MYIFHRCPCLRILATLFCKALVSPQCQTTIVLCFLFTNVTTSQTSQKLRPRKCHTCNDTSSPKLPAKNHSLVTGTLLSTGFRAGRIWKSSNGFSSVCALPDTFLTWAVCRVALAPLWVTVVVTAVCWDTLSSV